MRGQCGWEARFLELLGEGSYYELFDPPRFVKAAGIGIVGMPYGEFLDAEDDGDLPARGEGWDIANLVPPPERGLRERVAKIICEHKEIRRSALLRKVQHFVKADGLDPVLVWMWADGDIEAKGADEPRTQGYPAEVYTWLGDVKSPTVLDERDDEADEGPGKAT